MTRCWSCGTEVHGGLRYIFSCPSCNNNEELKKLRTSTIASFKELERVQERGFEALLNVIEWGFSETIWQLEQQTAILKSIVRTLQTPRQTQAEELRIMAEQLRTRQVLDEAEKCFLKALDLNLLDYRIYTGLAFTYLQMGDLNKARNSLEKSLPHAPCDSIKQHDSEKDDDSVDNERDSKKVDDIIKRIEASIAKEREEERALKIKLKNDLNLELIVDAQEAEVSPSGFDYKSYSYRLIGRTYFCEENYVKAIEALQSSVKLTPKYYNGYYDLAQYAALYGNKEVCLSALRTAVLGKPMYFRLARVEKNLTSFKREVQDQLEATENSILSETRQTISKLKGRMKEFLREIELVDFGKLQQTDYGFWGDEQPLCEATVPLLQQDEKLAESSGFADRCEILFKWKGFPISAYYDCLAYVRSVSRLSIEMDIPWFSRIARGRKVPDWWSSHKWDLIRMRDSGIKDWRTWLHSQK